MPSHAKIEVCTEQDGATIMFHFLNMNSIDRRKTIHALRPVVDRITGVKSVVKTEHSLRVTVDKPSHANAVTDHVVRMFCERLKIADAKRALVETSPTPA
jgi:spore coat polysaccharide biosynthesis protein SpsF (cytidylyltransferase family)